VPHSNGKKKPKPLPSCGKEYHASKADAVRSLTRRGMSIRKGSDGKIAAYRALGGVAQVLGTSVIGKLRTFVWIGRGGKWWDERSYSPIAGVRSNDPRSIHWRSAHHHLRRRK